MKKYIRTKEGNIYQRFFKDKSIRGVGGGGCCDQNLNPIGETVIKESDNLEELIQPNDLVFYWNQNDDKEHCVLMVYPDEVASVKFQVITKLLIPIGDDYKCVAKAEPTFVLIKERKCLVNKGELKLL